ncbi:MAG: hypothetical protein EBT86_00800 [Actinobacteria bacterium]|nr:hypothetical protein [Actinomycetota bacterium]
MGHSIVFYTDNREVMKIVETKWLRNDAPREIGLHSPYFLKETLDTREIANYAVILRQYIADLELQYPEFPIEKLRKAELSDSKTQSNFNKLIENIYLKACNHCGLSELYEELNDLFDILVEEDRIHPGFADDVIINFWEFQEVLEAGLFMKSSEIEEKVMFKDIYDILINFINILEHAVNKGWTAKWSY